jgi:phospholipid/cholesterol/gamma-HCH transport system substrate-binding protein
MNDPTLYNNLSSTSNKLNTLLDDFRVHPKRYISFPLIGSGKKKNQSPLATPLPDTLDAPYNNN